MGFQQGLDARRPAVLGHRAQALGDSYHFIGRLGPRGQGPAERPDVAGAEAVGDLAVDLGEVALGLPLGRVGGGEPHAGVSMQLTSTPASSKIFRVSAIRAEENSSRVVRSTTFRMKRIS